MREVWLGNFKITETGEPYLIAEIGVNHEGSLETAKHLIELAKEGGAHAAKFQSYKAETLASRHSPSYWDLSKEKTTSQFELFKKYDSFGPDEYLALAEHCKKNEIEFLSTPFDDRAVDFLGPLVPFYKIASADLTNLPFLRNLARRGKPVVLSTGASRLGEIERALSTLRSAGCNDIVLLHCVLNYPTPDENAHLSMITGLREAYPDLPIGYSDHTVPDSSMLALTTAYLMGARVIEKHFTNDKSLPGNDHYHAMDRVDARIFTSNVRRIRELAGRKAKMPIPSEKISRQNARRSIVLSRPVRAGEVLAESDLIPKRPGTGISPVYWERVIGSAACHDLDEDHVLQWEDLETRNLDEKIVVILQARMGSERFPGKMMASLGECPLIEWLLQRLKRARSVDEIVLVTSKDARNDVLGEAALRYGVSVVRGDENDVLSRFVLAANQSDADIIVRVCGDNPFVDPDEIDRLVGFYKAKRPDYSFNHLCRLLNAYADGFGAEVFSRCVLEELNRSAVDPADREHVTRFIWQNEHAFEIRTFQAPRELAFEALRFDIDTPQDLARLQPLASKVGIGGTAADFVRAELERGRA